MARSNRMPQSQEAVMLAILSELPAPGGANLQYKDLQGICSRTTQTNLVPWAEMPPSCDPVFILDNPANNTRRKGSLEQQLSQMWGD